MNKRPGHIPDRQKSRRSRPFSFYIRPGVPRIFLTALHSCVAVGCPDDCGEQLLATENSQPVNDKPIADATPYPLPAGSRLLQDRGFLAFTLPAVVILMPTKKPRGQELSLEEQHTNQALNQRRLRIEHVHSSVKRCRIVKDRIRLWKQGIRDLVMEFCCALHNFRVRLNPWLLMI
ncbi:MAG TPA: transposase family protein [Anaerolineales bacterium]|nr:transposase family protein [Anaerolineales bacterium]